MPGVITRPFEKLSKSFRSTRDDARINQFIRRIEQIERERVNQENNRERLRDNQEVDLIELGEVDTYNSTRLRMEEAGKKQRADTLRKSVRATLPENNIENTPERATCSRTPTVRFNRATSEDKGRGTPRESSYGSVTFSDNRASGRSSVGQRWTDMFGFEKPSNSSSQM